MAEGRQDISETRIVPPTCREQFLPLGDESAWPLRERGVLGAGISDLVPPFTIGRVRPPFHVVLFTVAGGADFVTPTGAGTMGPGDVWIGTAGQTYQYTAHTGWRVHWFHLSALPHGAVLPGVTHAPVNVLSSLCPAMEGLVAEAVRQEPGGDTAARAYAEIIGCC